MHRLNRFNPPRYPLGRAGLALAAGGALAAFLALELQSGAGLFAASALATRTESVEAPADLGPSLIGFGTVRDGTTVIVDDKEVRLWGITPAAVCDPARSQTERHLAALIDTAAIVCTGLASTDEGLTGRCGSGQVTDLSQQMAFDGFAVDDRQASGGMYADEEALAAAEGHGLWRADGWGASLASDACD
jgi:endonuclease YncB( thermonuclease family)